MKKTFSKFIATAAAVSMLASVAAVVNANEAAYTFETTTCDAGLIITGVTNGDDLVEIQIPETIDDKAVVGVADFAFADLDNLTNIYPSASIKAANTGNAAFVTKQSLAAFIEEALGEEPTKDTVIAYIAKTFNYENTADVEAKVMNKAALAGVTLTEDMTADELIEAAAVMVQNEDAMNLSAETATELAVWEATVTYTKTAVIPVEGSEMAKYIADKKEAGMDIATTPITAAKLGDANLDGNVDVRDCAHIASTLAKGKGAELPASADYNEDGNKDVRDAAALASALAKKA